MNYLHFGLVSVVLSPPRLPSWVLFVIVTLTVLVCLVMPVCGYQPDSTVYIELQDDAIVGGGGLSLSHVIQVGDTRFMWDSCGIHAHMN